MTFDLARIGAGLPFTGALPALDAALAGGAAVVQAPPGTGKTTLVPPAVANRLDGAQVLVTQPRRVATRAAARRLAQLDGVPLGRRVGYAVRGERRPGELVEFVTPGLLLRRLLADPELAGVGAVVLDEVHERGLDTDLLVGMLGQVRELREDLTLVAMSATLDAARFADLLRAPVVAAELLTHPLTIDFAPPPGPRLDERGLRRDFLDHVAAVTADALGDGDALVFLPGAREVADVASRLRGRLADVEVLELHGRVDPREQDRAVAGRGPGEPRRVVVATDVAESSLTVPGVNLVVDAALTREPRRDAARGMSGLVTVSASRSSCEQRAGRAARTGPGRAIRCVDERTYAAAPAHVTPEILTADLTGAALLLAAWGSPGGADLALPDPPPAAALTDAVDALTGLGALDPDGRITPLGTRLAAVPADPRWARALLDGAPLVGDRVAAEVVAAVAGDERAEGADLTALLRRLRATRPPAWTRETERLRRMTTAEGARTGGRGSDPVGLVVALAYPERIARRVDGVTYLLAGGTRAALPAGSPLAGQEWLAVAEVARADGAQAAGTGAVIRAAAPLTEAGALTAGRERTRVDAVVENGRVLARRVRALGAIELSSTPVRAEPAVARAAHARALRERGLSLPEPAEALRRRLALVHRTHGAPWPDVSDEALLAGLEGWFAPELDRLAKGANLATLGLTSALKRLLPWPEATRLDELAPERLRVPSGNTAALTYPPAGDDGPPVLAVKLQETFGWERTPRIADGRSGVLLHLLDPARRPLAVTEDLASFWSGPYAQVRAQMRGRYPKHPWPEDPRSHAATAATNRRLRR